MSNTFTPQVSSKSTITATTARPLLFEPLHSGYGMTLGNSLRRVLLPASPVLLSPALRSKAQPRIHYCPRRQRRCRRHHAEPQGYPFPRLRRRAQNLRIVKKGQGLVTAKDIQTNADVEVVNPDHVIATIDDDKPSFTVMDLLSKSAAATAPSKKALPRRPAT
jgi:DNA-directed RNA polymerase subunit alpha